MSSENYVEVFSIFIPYDFGKLNTKLVFCDVTSDLQNFFFPAIIRTALGDVR